MRRDVAGEEGEKDEIQDNNVARDGDKLRRRKTS